MEQNYNRDSVQELLAWARNLLQDKAYPKEPFQLNESTRIIDCARYLETMIATVEDNWENPTFHPAIDQLRRFREAVA